MQMHMSGAVRVVPVILRPVDWKDAPFGTLLALPTDGKPVTKWSNRDSAFLDITEGIKSVLTEFHESTEYKQRAEVPAWSRGETSVNVRYRGL
jgi:hypothetical protein